MDLRDAREVIEAWRVDYNTVRPHSSLRYLRPEEFAESVAARPASPPRRSSLSTQHGQVRMCRNPRVLTYDWTKNGGQVILARPYFQFTTACNFVGGTGVVEPEDVPTNVVTLSAGSVYVNELLDTDCAACA